MKAMGISEIGCLETEDRRKRMKIMEKYNGVLDKIIVLLCGNGCSNYTNLHVKRIIDLYGRPWNKALERNAEQEKTGEHITTEPDTVVDVELIPKEKLLA